MIVGRSVGVGDLNGSEWATTEDYMLLRDKRPTGATKDRHKTRMIHNQSHCRGDVQCRV